MYHFDTVILITGGSCTHMGAGVYVKSVPTTQFLCEPKTAPKNIYLKKLQCLGGGHIIFVSKNEKRIISLASIIQKIVS